MNKIICWFIITNFIIGISYDLYQIFWILQPAGHIGPLGSSALEISKDLFFARRAYAIEAWIAISGLSIFLAIISNNNKEP